MSPALPDSQEELFHETGLGCFLLPLRALGAGSALGEPWLQRAIGVVYAPQSER